MKNKLNSIALFHKIKDFERANGITALSPAKVMVDLSYEINVPPEQLYILSDKLIDGIYNSDNPLLYGERIAAIQTISENGISSSPYINDLDADTAYDFLLQCPSDVFMALVDEVAKINQSYYTVERDSKSDHEELIDKANSMIQEFISQKRFIPGNDTFQNDLKEDYMTPENNNRMDALRTYKEKDSALKHAAEVELQNKTNHLISRIIELEPRINELITIGNACLENNISLTGQNDMRQSYDTNYFVTNSWSHLVGFVCNPRDKSSHIEFLGINGGGACGKYDFRTDGVKVFSVNESNPHDKITPPIGIMENFLRNFDEFESSFYSYVDKVIENQQKSVDKLIASAEEKLSSKMPISPQNTQTLEH